MPAHYAYQDMITNTVVAALLLTSTVVPSTPVRESLVDASARSARELALASPLRPDPPVRAAVSTVGRPSKGAVIGGILGAAVGAVAGVATSVNLGMKQCGASCSDEKALIGLSLVGMPVAGAYLGAKLFGR